MRATIRAVVTDCGQNKTISAIRHPTRRAGKRQRWGEGTAPWVDATEVDVDPHARGGSVRSIRSEQPSEQQHS